MNFPRFRHNPKISVRKASSREKAGKGRKNITRETMTTNAPGALCQSTSAGPPIFRGNKPRRPIEKTVQPLYNLRKRARCVIRHGQFEASIFGSAERDVPH